MNTQQKSLLEELKKDEWSHSKEWFEYWLGYSGPDHWQFWIGLALLIVPLIAFFLLINKRNALQLGFYGYNVHVFFTYIDLYGANNGYWFYPYKVLPILPSSFALDVSFVPVFFSFIYQWSQAKQKNYYVWSIILSAVFAFVLKPLFVAIGMFEFGKGANYLHLFIGYVIVALTAKWMTNLFLYFEKKAKVQHS
ncbi:MULTISPECIES: CBO0543 family protein [unclassified Niallia]|uniref:CBO0543 family protein n=1 Tax=Niallia TaxID=2837506 RepID=UPI001EDBB80F|nr:MULTISPECIES: CBO0543 family protein [unclassified Niallia]MCM3031214.1 hypothetical protein [Niallia sp. MER 6]MDL0434790.1 CBO0543 family protein [Niallia sp. SS-2023]UPO89388.1 hypothetical protein L8T27_009655 [Niallia sp. Man26]